MPTKTCATPTGPESPPLTVTVDARDLATVLDELLRRGLPDGDDGPLGREAAVRSAALQLIYALLAASKESESAPGGKE